MPDEVIIIGYKDAAAGGEVVPGEDEAYGRDAEPMSNFHREFGCRAMDVGSVEDEIGLYAAEKLHKVVVGTQLPGKIALQPSKLFQQGAVGQEAGAGAEEEPAKFLIGCVGVIGALFPHILGNFAPKPAEVGFVQEVAEVCNQSVFGLREKGNDFVDKGTELGAKVLIVNDGK